MNILLAGGTGLIGSEILHYLQNKGHTINILSRKKPAHSANGVHYFEWDPQNMILPPDALQDADAIINLCGAGIADKHWTFQRKKLLIESRVKPLQCIKIALQKYSHKVKHIISFSAIGFYGNTGEAWVDETSKSLGNDFMVECCRLWEKAANDLQGISSIVSIIRTGIVLHKTKGAYPKLVNPVRVGIIPLLDGGKAYYSWIHIADMACIVGFILEHSLQGTFNAVAPQPVRLKQLMLDFASIKVPFYLPVYVPAIALKIGMGEMSAVVLNSNRVSSAKLESAGYLFKYANIHNALVALEGESE